MTLLTASESRSFTRILVSERGIARSTREKRGQTFKLNVWCILHFILDEVADSGGVSHIKALRDPAVLRCGLLS